jgi:hypothetical protein
MNDTAVKFSHFLANMECSHESDAYGLYLIIITEHLNLSIYNTAISINFMNHRTLNCNINTLTPVSKSLLM